jgi:aminoglycoside-2''-adenylyltransferase
VNDLAFVLRVVDLLCSHGMRTWVFGGWGEELRGLAAPRTHEDVDLLYPAPDWRRVDALELEWIRAKRFPWKRAFVLDETMVELLLVERDAEGWVTNLPAGPYRWPPNVFAAGGRLPVASAAALAGYRAAHASRRAA